MMIRRRATGTPTKSMCGKYISCAKHFIIVYVVSSGLGIQFRFSGLNLEHLVTCYMVHVGYREKLIVG